MSISVTSMQEYFFEVSYEVGDDRIKSYQITVNRVNQGLPQSNNDSTSIKTVTANDAGDLVKAQVPLPLPTNITEADNTTEWIAYFEKNFIINVIGRDASQNELASEQSLRQYVLAPSEKIFGNVNVSTSSSNMVVTASLLEPSFDTGHQLKYLILIEGPSYSGSSILSRTITVDASYGNLYWSSNGTVGTLIGEDRLRNNTFYDVTVFAYNNTGTSPTITAGTKSQFVSADANAPVLSVGTHINQNDSTGFIEVTVTGNGDSTDPDEKYVLTIAKLDASNVILETKEILNNRNPSTGALIAGQSHIYRFTGLIPMTRYVIKATAKNSTPNMSAATVRQATPEAVPSGLEIKSIFTGLNADEKETSGTLRIQIDEAKYRANGSSVTREVAYVKLDSTMSATEVDTAVQTASFENFPGSFDTPFYNRDGNYIANSFTKTGLDDGDSYLVIVKASNDDNPTTMVNTWKGKQNSQAVTSANLAIPVDHPEEPEFKLPQLATDELTQNMTGPILSQKSNLGSGNVRGVIQIPNPPGTGSAQENVPVYQAYRIFLEDASGADIAGQTSDWVQLADSDYLEQAFKGMRTDVVNDPYYDASYDLVVSYYETQGVSDSSYSITSGLVNKPSDNGQIRVKDNDKYLRYVFTGLTNGVGYTIKAQLRTDSEESETELANQLVYPSVEPRLNGNSGTLIPSIFKASSGKIYDDSIRSIGDITPRLEFEPSAFEAMTHTDGGYPITGYIVSIVKVKTLVNGDKQKDIVEEYKVIRGSSSGTRTDNGDKTVTGVPTLTADEEFDIHVTPYNNIYTLDIGFDNSFTLLQNSLHGDVFIGNFALKTVPLEITPGSVTFNNDGTKLTLKGNVMAESANTTEFIDVSGVITAQAVDQEGTRYAAADVKIPLSLSLDASNNFSYTLTVPYERWGWIHTASLFVRSKPRIEGTTTVYSVRYDDSIPQPSAGAKPTIYITDTSNIEVIPNGASTNITLVNLNTDHTSVTNGTVRSTVGTDVGNGQSLNITRNSHWNTTIGALENIEDASFSRLNNKFQIPPNNLEVTATNTYGRTTLFSESKIGLEVLSDNATLEESDVDGVYELAVGDETVKVKIALI